MRWRGVLGPVRATSCPPWLCSSSRAMLPATPAGLSSGEWWGEAAYARLAVVALPRGTLYASHKHILFVGGGWPEAVSYLHLNLAILIPPGRNAGHEEFDKGAAFCESFL